MKNLKIGKKFIVTFGIIMAMMLTMSYVGVTSLTSTTTNFEDFYNEPFQNTKKAMDMRRAIQAAAKNVGYATMSPDLNDTKEYVDLAQAELEFLAEGIEFLRANFKARPELTEEFFDIMSKSVNTKESVMQNALINNNDEAIRIFFDEYQPYLLEANAVLEEIAEASAGNADNMFNQSEKEATMATMLLIAIVAGTVVFTIMLAVYLTRSLTKPIKELEHVASKMAEGDMDVTIEYTSKDELGLLSEKMRYFTEGVKAIIGDISYLLGEMGDGNFDVSSHVADKYIGSFAEILTAMRAINTNLSNTLSQINQSSDQVSSGSEQVASGAQALSQGATEQASSIEELSATISEISAQIKQNAENARAANQLSSEAGQETEAGNVKMQDMIKAMEEITNTSNEIGKIIKTIDDIAFQTNILALNAAVEAARAGSAGKGFAVVADEVRNLAGKSAEAAKSTTALIESSINAVANGTEIVDDTAKSLTVIVDKSRQVTQTIEEIARASAEQASAVNQVTLGVDQISAVVQTNSATAEESAAASEELSSQSVMLKSLVSKFTLKKDGSSQASVNVMPNKTGEKNEYAAQTSVVNTSNDKY